MADLCEYRACLELHLLNILISQPFAILLDSLVDIRKITSTNTAQRSKLQDILTELTRPLNLPILLILLLIACSQTGDDDEDCEENNVNEHVAKVILGSKVFTVNATVHLLVLIAHVVPEGRVDLGAVEFVLGVELGIG